MSLQGAPDKNPGIEKVTQKIKLSLSRIPPKNGSLIEVQLIEFSQNTCIHAIFQTQQKTCSFILHPGDSRIMRDFLQSSEVDLLAKSKCHNTSLKGGIGTFVPWSRNSKVVYLLTGGSLFHQLIHLSGQKTDGYDVCEVFANVYELDPSHCQWMEVADSHHQMPTTYAADHACTVCAQSHGKTSRLGAKVGLRTESR